jgi:hypothetical protein
MAYTVKKDFRTTNRRFKVGDSIVPSDIQEGDAVSFETWVAKGFVADSDTTTKAPSHDSAPAEPADKKGFFTGKTKAQ